MNEMPSITASTYTSNSLTPAMLLGAAIPAQHAPPHQQKLDEMLALMGKQQPAAGQANLQGNKNVSTARIVKVFIADPNDNLPLDKRVIYNGDEKLTDSTDQELFFEVPIGDLLAKQNAVRAATVDKKQSEKSGRDIFLEPARIRDLRMVVVTVAQF